MAEQEVENRLAFFLGHISSDVARILKLPDVQERFASRGAVPKPSTPEEFDRFVRFEIDKLSSVIKAAGVRPN